MTPSDLESTVHALHHMADLLSDHVENALSPLHRDQRGQIVLQERQAELILFGVYDVAERAKAARDLFVADMERAAS